MVFIINNNEFNSIKSMEGHVMNGELIGRILMILVGFILAFLGVIVFIHGEHYEVGILISFSGIVSMFAGVPHYE